MFIIVCDNFLIFKFLYIHRPTTTKDKLYQHSDNEYFKAEEFGRLGEPCDKIFNECTHSILDQFSGAYNPILQKIVKIFG